MLSRLNWHARFSRGMTEISRDPKRGSRVPIESIRKVKIGNWRMGSNRPWTCRQYLRQKLHVVFFLVWIRQGPHLFHTHEALRFCARAAERCGSALAEGVGAGCGWSFFLVSDRLARPSYFRGRIVSTDPSMRLPFLCDKVQKRTRNST